jgi:6-phosphofructokinase
VRERIGILTGGGDCPGLNTVIRAVVKCASKRGWDTVGFLDGFEGMLEPLRYRQLDYKEMDALLFVGGTVLGTSNKGRFAAKTGHGESNRIPREILDLAEANFQKLGLRALVVVGGDGSLSSAQQLFEHGVPVIGVPKTIDNDLEATVMTFGFDSAVACATDALDRLRTTAESHDRVMVLEVMGRYTGWIAVTAGISGGGDVILIPEIPFNFESVCAKVADREREGKHFTLVVVAEGAREQGKDYVTAGNAEKNREARLGGDWRGRGRGNPEAHRQGNACLRAGPFAAWRCADLFRPGALHTFRRAGRPAYRRRAIRLHGGLAPAGHSRGEDFRSRWPFARRPAAR